MKATKNNLCLLSLLLITTSTACSPKPHLGDSTSEVEMKEGITVTQSEDRYMLPGDKLGGSESTMISASAKVENVDYKNRRLTIRTKDNRLSTLNVGKEIVNFPQIKAGDNVAVDYYLSVNFEAREPSKEEKLMADKTLEVSARAARGEKPAIASVEEGVKIVTVESIDKSKEVVVFRGAEGDLTAVKAKYPENLSYIKKGDKVVLKLTEAFAARIVPIN